MDSLFRSFFRSYIGKNNVPNEEIPDFTPGCGADFIVEVGRAIAQWMGRPFQRIRLKANARAQDLLGTSSSMGLMMKAVVKAKCCNLVIFIDDVEKVKNRKVKQIISQLGDHRKNRSFFDRFLGVPFDLSEVLFIVSIDSKSLQREKPMKLSHFSPSCPLDEFTTEQCVEVMKHQLIPKVLPEYNRESSPLHDSLLKVIVDDFTHK
ncbi:hypothetical protein QR680_008586 [Steinernema hermaphroditum]|uniref:ATPase AAA-type core domain-containing protein n=1 Tax=Steinernema hermaphroditum TaxID=289476 RepID=A0AA39IJE0_9BILA|nr:hypothetical protein QR680_008586 [Steinernema hermaphroditum]